MNKSEYLNNNNDNMDEIFKKTSTTFVDLKNSLISLDTPDVFNTLKTVDDFNLHHLINLKQINYNGSNYGIVHIQLKYFVKKNNYDYILDKLDNKMELGLNMSLHNSGNRKIFILLDLSNIGQRNYSRKFIRLLTNRFTVKYDDCMALCYLYGNMRFVKMVWPFITTLIDSKTKNKLVLLK